MREEVVALIDGLFLEGCDLDDEWGSCRGADATLGVSWYQ